MTTLQVKTAFDKVQNLGYTQEDVKKYIEFMKHFEIVKNTSIKKEKDFDELSKKEQSKLVKHTAKVIEYIENPRNVTLMDIFSNVVNPLAFQGSLLNLAFKLDVVSECPNYKEILQAYS